MLVQPEEKATGLQISLIWPLGTEPSGSAQTASPVAWVTKQTAYFVRQLDKIEQGVEFPGAWEIFQPGARQIKCSQTRAAGIHSHQGVSARSRQSISQSSARKEHPPAHSLLYTPSIPAPFNPE